jgi:hypothetical protein
VAQANRTSAFPVRGANDPLGGKYDPLADCPDLLDTLSRTSQQRMGELTRFPGVRKYLARLVNGRSANERVELAPAPRRHQLAAR